MHISPPFLPFLLFLTVLITLPTTVDTPVRSAHPATRTVYIRGMTHTRSDTAGHVPGGDTYKQGTGRHIYTRVYPPRRHIYTRVYPPREAIPLETGRIREVLASFTPRNREN